MSHISSGKVHFFFGIISLLIIVIVGTLMQLTSIAGGILWIIFILAMAPVLYIWISKTKKHDHGYTDHDFKNLSSKHRHD
jgi:TRAP-type uncharacterized transport system fused permease subunit